MRLALETATLAEDYTMKKVSRADLLKHFGMLRSDPRGSLKLHDAFVAQHPSDPHGYYARHQVWVRLGRRDLALDDLNKAIAIEPNATRFEDRGTLLRDLGLYRQAIEDFNRAQALEPDEWKHSLAPLLRADCHARLGNEEAALADCASLRDDYSTPGLFGFPPGDKQAVTAEIRRRVAAARKGKP